MNAKKANDTFRNILLVLVVWANTRRDNFKFFTQKVLEFVLIIHFITKH